MRKGRFVAVMAAVMVMLVCMTPSGSCAAAETANSLSIQEALDIAYKKNPDLRKAELSLESAQITRDDAAELLDYIPVNGLVDPSTYKIANSYQTAEINLNTAKKNQLQVKSSIGYSVINAYTQAVRSRNSMETARLSLDNMRNQQQVISLSKAVGLTAVVDNTQFMNSLQLAEESYKSAQLAYAGSVASLAALLGQNEDWKPELTSRALLETYPREELSLEISRAISESVLVTQQSAQLDIEKSKKDWILQDMTTEQKNISLGLAEANYEQARNNARSQLEQLYYSIETLEGQIKSGKLICEQAQQDLEIAQLKYELGLLPRISAGNNSSLETAQLALQQDTLALESYRAALAVLKAQYAYLTGQPIYDAADWTDL